MKKLSSSEQREFARQMRRDLANMDFSFGPGKTLTSPGKLGAVKDQSASFSPIVMAPRKARVSPRQQNMAIQQAGQILPVQKEKKITPEQTFDQSLFPSPDPTASSLIDPNESVPAPKVDPQVSAARIQQYLLAKFNPIRGLTPNLLTTYFEQFDLGFLRQAELVWDKIRERDDQIQAVTVKRELRPTDMEWEIIQLDDSPEADQHKQALEKFYTSISATHALQQDARGGMALLIRQMMRAVGDRYSVHEVIWRPQDDGTLSAELRWIPPWFFEARTGKLRFLPYELALQGMPLDPGGWMVHTGEGLFQATAVAFIIKSMALKYWASYCEKFGLPFLHGKTAAQYGSVEWEQFKNAIAAFSSDGAILTNLQAALEPITMPAQGSIPQPPLVDRMDRAIGRIWSGGDLSTMSRGNSGSSEHGGSGGGLGSNSQMGNEDKLAAADAMRITDTCRFYLDRYVIYYLFGTWCPKAQFTLEPPRETDAQREILVDTFLMGCGIEMSKHDLAERYGRGLLDPEEATDVENLAHPPPSNVAAPGADAGPLGNTLPSMRPYIVKATKVIGEAQARALRPVRERLLQIASLPTPEAAREGIAALRRDLPRMVGRVAGAEALIKALDDTFSTAAAIGMTSEAKKHLNGHNHHEVFSVS